MNVPVLVAVPAGVVTLIGPEVELILTIAVNCVAETTLKELAVCPLNFTAVVPRKFAPLIVTVAPDGPLVGEKLVIVGRGLKEAEEVAVPPAVVTVIVPIVALFGTVAAICVEELTVKVVALVPLKATDVAPVRLVPVITTLVPTGPLVGLKLVIVGEPMTVKLLALVAVPPGVVTEIVPVVAPAGTVAVI